MGKLARDSCTRLRTPGARQGSAECQDRRARSANDPATSAATARPPGLDLLSKCDENTKRAPWRCLTWEYRDSQRKANRAAGRHFFLASFQEGRGERYWLHGRESRTSNETRLIASPKRTNGPLARAPATRSASAKLNSDRARSTERRAGEQILNHRQPMRDRLPTLYAQQRYRVPSDDTQCQFKR